MTKWQSTYFVFEYFNRFPTHSPHMLLWFLVGAFSLEEKSPTITVGSFFSWHNLTLNGPLFLQFLQSHTFLQFLLSKFINNGAKAYEVVFLHHLRNSTGPKCTPLEYFWVCETFSEKNVSQRVHSIFLEFSDRTDVEKSQRVPLLVFSALWDFFLFFHQEPPFFDDLRQNGWKICVPSGVLLNFWVFRVL